jgi:hypothetical protein
MNILIIALIMVVCNITLETLIQNLWNIKPNFGYRMITFMMAFEGFVIAILTLSYFGVLPK